MSPGTRIAVVAATCCLIIAGLAVFADSSESYVINTNCSFPGSNPRLDYWKYSLTSSWNAAFDSGQAAWDSATPGYGAWFNPTSSSSAAEIKVYDDGFSDTWTALTTLYGDCTWWGGLTWAKITFNLNQDTGMDATDRKKVAVHELGHVISLKHTYYNCSNPSVMRQGLYVIETCGRTDFPFSDDTSGAYAVYH